MVGVRLLYEEWQGTDNMETIHIYHTNDVHSHFENWPRISQFLKNEKERLKNSGEEVFLFDIGDFVDRWHPFTEATRGKGNVAMLNECQYTAATIGNNEGVNLPHEDLDHLYDEAQFEVLAANFYQADGSYPSWVLPYKIYLTEKGTRIGVLGLTAPFYQLYEQLGWKLSDPVSELKKCLGKVREESDIVLLLSHLGIHEDEAIAESFPEIDVILGAHTHHSFAKGERIGDTLVGAAGKYGYYVGHVSLKVNEAKEIIANTAVLYEEKTLPVVPNEEAIIDSLFQKGKELLNERVITLSKPLLSDPFHETELSHLLCRALREWCKSDCAMINAGLLLGPLTEEVTVFDLLTICPHPINPCVVNLTGTELKEIILETMDENLPHRKIKGLGFRGTVLGVFMYEGIRFENSAIYINDEPLDPEKMYSLALPDMFTFGHFFKNIVPEKSKQYFLPEFLRDILKWELQKQS